MLELSGARQFILSFIAFMFLCFAPEGHTQGETPPDPLQGVVSYKVSIEKDGPNPYFLVEMRFPSMNVKEFTLRHQSYSECPKHNIEIVELHNATPIEDGEQDERNILYASPTGEAPISLTYKITPGLNDFAFNISDIEGCTPIVLGADNFYIDGGAFFLAARLTAPDGERFGLKNIELSFSNMPQDWELATSIHNFKEDEVYQFENGRAFFGSLILAGKTIKTSSFQSGETEFSMFMLGNFLKTFDETKSDLEKLLPYLNKKLGASDLHHYSVFLIPISSKNNRFGKYTATAKWDSQVLFFTPSTKPELVTYAFVHELVHNWIPGKLGRRPAAWIREGITDYVSNMALIDLGLDDHIFFLGRLNMALKNRGLKPAKALDPYDEGLLTGLALDGRHHGIHDLMRSLIEKNKEELTEALFFRTAKDIGLLPKDAPLQKNEIQMPCIIRFGSAKYTLKTGLWPDSERGFTFDENTPTLIKTVAPQSRAYKAGIRKGQTVLRHLSGWSNDIISPYILLIQDLDGTQRQISYYPRGALGKVPYAQYINDNTKTKGWAEVKASTHCRL